MIPPPSKDELIFRGRLSWVTFIKVCFIGVVGAAVMVGGAFLLLGMIHTLVAPYLDRPAWANSPSLEVQMHSLLASAAWTLVWAVLVGVLGYPFYKGLALVREGLVHRVLTDLDAERGGARRYLQELWPALRAVPATFVLSLAVAVMALTWQVPIYRSTSMLLISPAAPAGNHEAPLGEPMTLHSDLLFTQQHILSSRTLMKRAQERINRPADEIAESLKSVSVDNRWGGLLAVVVRALDPVLAADMANALTDEYIDFKAEQSSPVSVQILERAVPAARPDTPRKSQALALAGLLGIGLGMLIALVWAGIRYEKTVRNEAENTIRG